MSAQLRRLVTPFVFLLLLAATSDGSFAQTIGQTQSLGNQKPTTAVPFIPPAPIPEEREIFTSAGTVQLRAALRNTRQVEVQGPDGVIVYPAGGGSFQVSVAPPANVATLYYLTAIGVNDARSAPAQIRVVRDIEAPNVFIDAPAAGAEVTVDSVDVAGRVGDMLSGFYGLGVTVNGVVADVDVGFGNNGTFIARDVPLVVGSPAEPTTLIATATDRLGNSASMQIEVTRVSVPAGASTIERTGGNGQSGPTLELLPSPLTARVLGGSGQPIVGKVVRFHVGRSDGRLSATAAPATGAGAMTVDVLTDAQGVARAWWTLGSDSGCGNNRVSATSMNVIGTVEYCATALPGVPDRILLGEGDDQAFEKGAVVPKPLQVFVSDGTNGVPAVPVTYTVVRGAGTLEGSSVLTVMTDVTGHARAAFRLGETSTENVVEVDFPGNPGPPNRFFALGLDRTAGDETAFEGLVLDNEQRPLGGALCHLSVAGLDAPAVVTNAEGVFRFPKLDRAGPAHLVVEGETVTTVAGLSVPAGTFPHLAYDTFVVEGIENRLTTSVFLPELRAENSRTYDGTADIELTIPELPGLRMFIQAGSMTLADGTVPDATNPAVIALNPVHLDEIPMPIPNGVDAPFAWTLQPSGAHFDPPVQLEFPNMAGLPAGAAAFALSFNHDTHRFEIVASASVTDDATRVVSDEGAGISVAGWGAWCPPYPNTGTVEIDSLAKAKAVLTADQTDKIGTGAEALATQLLCLALASCGADPSAPIGTPLDPKPDWAGPFVESTIIFTADMINDPNIDMLNQTLGLFTGGLSYSDTLCQGVPGWLSQVNVSIPLSELEFRINDICAALGGGVHFAEHLLPAFLAYAIENGCDADLEMQHGGLIEDAIVPCFARQAETNTLSQDAVDIALEAVPVAAIGSRIFACEIAERIRGDNLLSPLGPAVSGSVPDGYPTLPDPSFYDIPAVDEWSQLDVSTGGQFYMPVGSTLQLTVLDGGVDVTSDPGTIYYAVGPDGFMDVTSEGLVSVTGTGLPLLNMVTPCFVVIFSNDQFGLAYLGIIDSDSDGDLIVDSVEVRLGLDPSVPNSLSSDLDGDLLPDLYEVAMSSDPLNPDTDMDGVSDADELDQRTHYWLIDSATPRLSDDHDVRVGTRGRRVGETGGFSVTSIPAGTNLQRIRSVGVVRDETWYGASDFVEVQMQQTSSVQEFELSRTPIPTPRTLALDATSVLLSQTGETTQLSVLADMSDDTIADLTQRVLGTTYVSSNPDVLSIGDDGLATGMGAGVVIVTARNEGVTATLPILVSSDDPMTEVIGFVEQADGSPASGIEVTVFPGAFAGVSDSDGRFSVSGAFTQLGNLTVIADNLASGTSTVGTIEDLVPVPGGLTDAGILVLEDAVFWAVDADGSWEDPANWSTGQVPQEGDNVLIDRGTGLLNVTLNSAPSALRSLRCGETLFIGNSGTLAVDQPFSIKGGLVLDGGRLDGVTVLPGTGEPLAMNSGFLDGVRLGSESTCDGTVFVENGLELLGATMTLGANGSAGRLRVSTSDPITGSGELILDGSFGSTGVRATNGLAPLQIDQGVTVRGSGTLGASSLQMILRGEVIADGPGSLRVEGMNWVNEGRLVADGGLLSLFGQFTLEGAGTFAALSTDVELSGVLSNGGKTLRLDSATGDLILNGGTIAGGVVQASGGARIVHRANGRLDGVTLGGEVVVESGSLLTVFNNLTLDGGVVRVQGFAQQAFLSFTDSDRLDGSGEVILEGSLPRAFLFPPTAGPETFTIASGVTVRGTGIVGVNSRPMIVEGALHATSTTSNLIVRGENWLQNGELRTDAGATLDLEGTLSFGPRAAAATSAGTVRVIGDIDNAGKTIRVSAGSGPWRLSGGSIIGGVVDSSDGVAWAADSAATGLDGVTLAGEVRVEATENLGIENGLAFAGGSITVAGDGQGGRVFFNGPDQTVDGPGTILLDGPNGTGKLRPVVGGTVTFGPSLLIEGSGEVGFVNSRFINEGTIRCDQNGGQLFFRGVDWVNRGSLIVGAGATIQTEGTWTQEGTLVATDADVIFGGTYGFVSAAPITRIGGTLSFRGTFQNSGSAFSASAATGDIELRQCTVVGGELGSTDGSIWTAFPSGSSAFDGVELSGVVMVPNQATLRTINGLVLSGGTIDLVGGFFSPQETQSLSGSGQISMTAGPSSPFINPTGSAPVWTVASGIVITGRGTIGTTASSIVNDGDIRADQAGGTLLLRGTSWANSGQLSALGGATLEVTDGWLNTGMVSIDAASELRSSGSVVQAGGTMSLMGGTIVAPGGVDIQAGVFSAQGAVTGGLSVAGVLEFGGSVGTLSVSGSWTQTAAGRTRVRVDGQTAGSSFDRLDVAGSADLDGTLELVVGGSFNGQLGDMLTVATHGGSTGALTLEGEQLGGGLKLDLSYLPAALRLEVTL